MLKEKLVAQETVLLLKTTDRYTGEVQTHSLIYRQYGREFVVAACNETEYYKPNWYLNLKEEPIVELEVDGATRYAIASTPIGTARVDIWPLVEDISIDPGEHQRRTVTGVILSPMD